VNDRQRIRGGDLVIEILEFAGAVVGDEDVAALDRARGERSGAILSRSRDMVCKKAR